MKKTIFALSVLVVPFLFGCNNSKVLEEWKGEYVLVNNNDSERCTLSLNEDGTYHIKYLDKDYQGTYTSYKADNDVGFKRRLEYYSNEDYPNEDIAHSYGITLLDGDKFTELPSVVRSFFENNGESNQHLFVHTFKNHEAYIKYSLAANYIEVDPDKTYKEIVYYPNEMVLPSADGTVIDYRKTDFYLIFLKIDKN